MKNKYKVYGEYTIIYLTNRKGEVFEAIIDTEDFDKINSYANSWHSRWNEDTQSYYARTTLYLGYVDGKPKYKGVYLHRVILELEEFTDDVDHKNHNTLDNRKNNLEIKNRQLNSINRKGKNKNNTSGYRNVSWIETYKKWVVQIQINGKNTLLGKFDDVHEAGAFAETMREKYYGEYAGNH